MAVMTKALGALVAAALGAASGTHRVASSGRPRSVTSWTDSCGGCTVTGVRSPLSAGREPREPDVDDGSTLADRVRFSPRLRSSCRTYLRHPHVMSQVDVAPWHGEVDDVNDVRAIEVAVGGSPGSEVPSRTCALGSAAQETRPSAGRAQPLGAAPPTRRRCRVEVEGERRACGEAVDAVPATFAIDSNDIARFRAQIRRQPHRSCPGRVVPVDSRRLCLG